MDTALRVFGRGGLYRTFRRTGQGVFLNGEANPLFGVTEAKASLKGR